VWGGGRSARTRFDSHRGLRGDQSCLPGRAEGEFVAAPVGEAGALDEGPGPRAR
jgi:hypothetical protein